MMQRFLLYLMLLLVMGSCNGQKEKNANSRNIITVSIRPQKYIVEQIAGDKYSVSVLVPDGSGPETYEPTSRQLRELAQSKLYISTGLLDFEKSWLPEVQELYPDLIILNSSEGIELIDGHSHDHSEGHEQGIHSLHAGVDPHIWLSFQTIKVQAKNIKASLSKTDPDNMLLYEQNYVSFVARLDSLDRTIRQQFSEVSGKVSFIIYHPSLGYYCRDYGVEQLAIEMDGKEPSASYIRELIDLSKENNITTVFYSDQFDKRSAETVASQLGIPLTPINPLAENVVENILDITRKVLASKSK